MAGREHEPGTVFECQDLYVIDGLTLAEVAARTGVPVATVEKWSVRHGWVQKRADYCQAEAEIREQEVKARKRLIERIVTEGDPMAAFGYSSLQGSLLKAREVALKEREAGRSAAPARTFASLEEARAALSEAITAKLGAVLAEPAALDLKTIKSLHEALGLAGSLSGKGGEDKDGKAAKGMPKQLDPETLKVIREQIYGLC